MGKSKTNGTTRPAAAKASDVVAGAANDFAETQDLRAARALRQRLAERLVELSPREDGNPLRNPMLRLSLDLLDEMSAGTLEDADIDGLIRLLAHDGFVGRAGRLRGYVGELDAAANDVRLDTLFRRLAHDGDPENGGALLPFDTFHARLTRSPFGMVFTAHPTFGLSRDLLSDLASLAADETPDGISLTEEDRKALGARVAKTDQGPNDPITLDDEHAQAEAAIKRAAIAVNRAINRALRVGQSLYPDRWTELVPRPLTIASWVGYDLDGRTDIGWADSLGKFLTVKAERLSRIAASVEDLRKNHGGAGSGDALNTALKLLASDVAMAAKVARDDAALFPVDGRDAEDVQRLATALKRNDDFRVNDTSGLLNLIRQAIAAAEDPSTQRALACLSADLETTGLATAHVHVRLNATQILNAIRHAAGMEEALGDPSHRRRQTTRLSKLIQDTDAESINFGSLMAERATARRLFMTVRQMLKYGDGNTPVRFLIAETESPLIVLSALYFAKLFGVDDRCDISPLFETPSALEHGAELIAELLWNKHYKTYVKARGRLCVQTGFSDAGRHLGQIACTLAVERLHMKLARLVANSGLHDVEVVIFDTHGESVGRGAHPAGLRSRFDYLSSPASRGLFDHHNIPVKHEVSFQGGDGYLLFGTPKLAYAAVTRMLEHVHDCSETPHDPFYDDADNTLSFFLTITRFNQAIMNHRDYGALVGGFAVNLLRSTGSRRTRRQHDSAHGIDWAHPAQLRAIPHNAVLHQLGWLANTLGGVGEAIALDPEWFAEIVGKSDRMRRMMGMVAHAEAIGSTHALAAHARLFEPEHWVTLAEASPDYERREAKRKVARLLGSTDVGERAMRIARVLRQDAMDLRDGLEQISTLLSVARPLDEDAETDRAILHALRLALIQRNFMIAARIPAFTNHPDVQPDHVVMDILNLDTPGALKILKEIFPADPAPVDLKDFEEVATYKGDGGRDYKREHETLFEPLAANHERVLRIGTAIGNLIGAHG